MSRLTLRVVVAAAFVSTVPAFLTSAAAQAQQPTWSPPAPSERCPSKWGAADERGSMNHMKPAAVLTATKLIRTGEVFELGHVLNGSMPFSGTRRFDLHTKRTFMNPQSNQRGSNEETVISEIGQVGTQFDMLQTGYEITIEDLQAALKRQGTALRPGDAVLIHGGWGKLWGKDNARYQTGGHAGIGVRAAEWLIKQDPLLLGADNGTVEISPNPDKLISLPVHQLALVVNGVHLLENLKLDELAAKKVYEFAFIMQPLKMQGGTGSTVAPVAVR